MLTRRTVLRGAVAASAAMLLPHTIAASVSGDLLSNAVDHEHDSSVIIPYCRTPYHFAMFDSRNRISGGGQGVQLYRGEPGLYNKDGTSRFLCRLQSYVYAGTDWSVPVTNAQGEPFIEVSYCVAAVSFLGAPFVLKGRWHNELSEVFTCDSCGTHIPFRLTDTAAHRIRCLNCGNNDLGSMERRIVMFPNDVTFIRVELGSPTIVNYGDIGPVELPRTC